MSIKMNNLFEQEPKRQHPLNILFNIIKSIREIIVPIVIFIVLNLNDFSSITMLFGLAALIIYLIYRLIVNIFIWKNNTYLFTEDNIELVEGRFISNKRTVALHRIQSYQQQTTFFHKLFRLTSFTIVTGTDNIKLDMITKEELERITNILKNVQPAEQEQLETNTDDHLTRTPVKKHYDITFNEIIIISLTSLYFLAIIPILLTIYSQLGNVIDVEKYATDFYNFATQSLIIAIVIVIFIFLISFGVGLITMFLRLGKYQVSSDSKQIYISRGILNTTNYTIPREKINGILIQKPFTKRLFRLVKVKFVSLGDIFEEVQTETDVLFPFIANKRLKKLLPEIVQDYPVKRAVHRLPKKAIIASLINPFIFYAIVTSIVFYFWPTFWYIPVIIFILTVIITITEVLQSHFISDETFIQFQTGALSPEIFVTRLLKIDEVNVTQTWIQRKLGLATISISTREKPHHVATMKNIQERIAFDYYNWYASGILHEKLTIDDRNIIKST